LTTEDDLAAWVVAETARIPDVGSAYGHLAEVRDLRAHVRAALFAAAEGRVPPPAAVAGLNAARAGALSYPVLGSDGVVEDVFVAEDAFARFRSVVARSAITILTGPDRDRLDVCRAPSCGMLFLRRGGAQKWCCDACGNRSRVARHAERHRKAHAGSPRRRA
jgi:predicted RNA-binding Zn ribbon-like protein